MQEAERTVAGQGAAATPAAARDYDTAAAWYDRVVVDPAPVIAFYTGLIRAGQASLLELGCGTGVVTAPMAARLRALAGGRAVRVVGLDAAVGMLEIAARRDPGIEWLAGDMRALPDCGRFELIACCYNTLQHLDAAGLGACFRRVRALLAPGGRFAFDIYRPNLPYLRITRQDDQVRRIEAPDGTMVQLLEDSVLEEEAGLLRVTWRVVDPARPAAGPLMRMELDMWQHDPRTVEAALAAAGLRIEERYGDLDRSAWSPTAKKQVVVCVAC
jgi:SAM-dependent methyltransferase